MSGPVLVADQAMRSLRPSKMPGTPGAVAPIAFSPGACRCAKYQMPGALRPRCGSLARSGLRLLVRAPDTTQLFEPPAGASLMPGAGGPPAAPYSAARSGSSTGLSPGYGGGGFLG